MSLGTHAALTAADATGLMKSAVALHLLAAAQAADLRAGCTAAAAQQLGAGTARLHAAVRRSSRFLTEDRALDGDVAALILDMILDRPLPIALT